MSTIEMCKLKLDFLDGYKWKVVQTVGFFGYLAIWGECNRCEAAQRAEKPFDLLMPMSNTHETSKDRLMKEVEQDRKG